MFTSIFRALRSGAQRAKRQPFRYSSRLNVELLEDRRCPTVLTVGTDVGVGGGGSGPLLTLSTVVMPGHMVELSGQVTNDANLEGTSISFGGAATGVPGTTTDASGHFDVLTNLATLGDATAVGIDQNNVSTNIATSPISVLAPTITLAVTDSTDTSVTLTGAVTGIDATSGEAVTIVGAASGSTVTDSFGNFTVTLPCFTMGSIDAVVIDSWSQTSTAEVDANIVYDIPSGEDFSASAGVGVLTDLVQPGNQTFMVTEVHANGMTFPPGVPIPMPSGATLTVNFDGSVVYLPGSFSGTDSFSVTAVYGMTTQTIDVQMLVGADPSFESGNTYSFTNVGNLQYVTNGNNYQSTLTDNTVPFCCCQPRRVVIIGACEVRIATQRAVTNLRYNDNSGSTVTSVYSNFTRNGAATVQQQAVHVRFDLKAAIDQINTDIAGFNAGNGFVMPARLTRWFGGTDYVNNNQMNNNILTTVIYYYNAIRDQMDGTTSYYDDPNDTGYGASPASDGSDISIGRLFWTGRPNIPIDMERYGTIIHELAHASSYDADGWMWITDDAGYFENPAAIQQNAVNPVRWYTGANNTTLMDPQPTTGALLYDADAYAGYLTQFYYLWGPRS